MRIAVVGGGVVGLSCALRLAQGGHRVTVLDASRDDGAPSWNNAGHIATEQVAPLASAATLRSLPRRLFAAGGPLDLPPAQWATWLPFAARLVAAARPQRFRHGSAALRSLLIDALPAWRRLVAALDAAELLQVDGHLVCWGDAAAAARGRRGWAAADTGSARIVDATREDARLVDALTPHGAAGGLMRFAGTAAITDLAALRGALRAGVRAAGGEIRTTTATPAMTQGRAVIAGVDADAVLVAAGIGSGTALRAFGHDVPIVAERGYHVRAAAGAWPADVPPIVFEDRAMIVTRYRDCVQAAGFVEFAAPDAPPDPRKWTRLERHVAQLGLPIAPPFRRWMGARPTLPDYLPAIGRSRRCDTLFYAFGHQHLGLTLAPVTAEIVARLVDGEDTGIGLAAFDLARFGARAGRA